MPGQSHDRLSVDGVVEQCQIMTVSALSRVLVVVEVLVDADDAQVPVMGPLREEFGDSGILGRSRHQVVQDDHGVVTR